MKITIDTDQVAGKVKEGIKKYGKYAVGGALSGGVASKGAKILGKKVKERADRKAIENMKTKQREYLRGKGAISDYEMKRKK